MLFYEERKNLRIENESLKKQITELNKIISNGERKINSIIADHDKLVKKYYSDVESGVKKEFESIRDDSLKIHKDIISDWGFNNRHVTIYFKESFTKSLIEWLNK